MNHIHNTTFKSTVQSISENLNEKPIQKKGRVLEDNRPASILQRKANNTGLPDNLKSGIENLSGHSMDDVKVHYNSDKPAQVNAHAYAQGSDIHIASGQEKHLPHEAWHVVQQKQGRVKPTLQMKGKVNVNDDKGLENEADVMGAKALQMKSNNESVQLKKELPINSQTLQRVTLAVGDLQEAQNKGKQLTPQEHQHAKVITDAEESYRKNTGEKQVHPWNERLRPFSSGPLNSIGTENLRIYGHGQVYEGDKSVSMIGNYTPQALSTKLIEMGLPEKYSAEIYLTGCETAVGRNRGYLGNFYKIISVHSPNVKVRGNLGTTVTHPNGVQGIWTGVIDEGLFKTTRNSLIEKKEYYLKKNSNLMKKLQNLLKLEKDLEKEKQSLINNGTDSQIADYLKRYKKFSKACEALNEAVKEVNEYIKLITKGILELDHIAYDPSGRLSITLPADKNELQNVKGAIADAEKAEKFRLTKLEIAEELASIYGWAESVVTQKLYSGEFDENANTRIKAQSKPTPSYIS